MSKIFPKSINALPLQLVIFELVLVCVAAAGITYYATPAYLRVGYQPVQPVLEHVIIGAAFERLDRHLVPVRAGHEDKGHLRAALPCGGQGAEAVKGRDPVVGENQVRRVMLQLVQELLAAFNPLGPEAQAGAVQFVLDELRIQRDVFDQQEAEFSFHTDRQNSLLWRRD